MIEVQHIIGNKDMDGACIYCGGKLSEERNKQVNYTARDCLECGKIIIKRKDFNDLGNGRFKGENIDKKVELELKKLFLTPIRQ